MNLLERIERDRKGSSLLEQIERDRQKLNNPKPTPATSTLLKPKAPQTTPNFQVNLNPVPIKPQTTPTPQIMPTPAPAPQVAPINKVNIPEVFTKQKTPAVPTNLNEIPQFKERLAQNPLPKTESSITSPEAFRESLPFASKLEYDVKKGLGTAEEIGRSFALGIGSTGLKPFTPIADIIIPTNETLAKRRGASAEEIETARQIDEMQKINAERGWMDKGQSWTPADKKQHEKVAETAGNIAGEIFKTVFTYGAAGGLSTAVPYLNKISNPFLRKLVTDQLIDNIVQTPGTIIQGIKDKKGVGETSKDLLTQNLIDAGLNLTMGGAEEGFKALKNTKSYQLKDILKFEKGLEKQYSKYLPQENTKNMLKNLLNSSSANMISDLFNSVKNKNKLKDIDNSYNELSAKGILPGQSKPGIPMPAPKIQTPKTQVSKETIQEQFKKLQEKPNPSTGNTLLDSIRNKYDIGPSTGNSLLDSVRRNAGIKTGDITPNINIPKPDNKLNALEETYKQRKAQIQMNKGLNDQEKAKRLKALGMQHSADKRALIQGDSLSKVEGGLTDKELKSKLQKEASNYIGKKVTVDGKEGVIAGNPYGKVKVQFDDGTVKTVTKDAITPVKFDKAIENNIKIAKPNQTVGTLGDYIQGEQTRELYKNVLDTPIKVTGDNKIVNGAFAEINGKPTILINKNTANIEDTIIEEASHALRNAKGRTNLGLNGLDELRHGQYSTLPYEKSADKLVSHVKTLDNIEGQSGQFKNLKLIESVKKSDQFDKQIKDKIKGDYQVKGNDQLVRDADALIRTDFQRAVDLAKRPDINTDMSNEVSRQLIQKYQKEGKWSEAIELVELTSKKAMKAGQSVQAFSLWSKMTPEGMTKYAQSLIDKANAKFAKMNPRQYKKIVNEYAKQGIDIKYFSLNPRQSKMSKIIQLTKDDAKYINNAMTKIGTMAEGRARDIEVAKVLDYIGAKIPPSVLQKISTLQTMAQLLNAKTTIRNVLGNAGFQVMELVSDSIGTPIDMLISTSTKQRTKFMPDIKVQAGGLKKGWNLGFEDAVKGIDTSGVRSQLDLPNRTFRNGFFGALEKAMNISLRAPDRAFYQAAYDQSIQNQMKAKGLKDINKITGDMIEQAHLDGLYKTFQDKNFMSEAFSKLKRTLNGGKEWGFGDLILKYPKTPANLLMRGIDYSPLGIVKEAFNLTKNGFEQKRFVESLSRSIVGTGILGTGALLYNAGIIQGKATKDKEANELLREAGTGQYTFNISAFKRFMMSGMNPEHAKPKQGDVLANYDWMQPLALPFTAGANIAEQKKNKKVSVGDALGAIVYSLEAGVDTLGEQPLVQNATKLLKGYGSISESFSGVFKDAPASFVPTFVNQVKQIVDNKSRDTRNNEAFGAKEALNKVIYKIPGMSQFLPERVTTTGKTRETYQDGSNNIFNVMLNPAFITKYNVSPAMEEILKLYRETGDTTVFPREAKNKMTFNNQTIELTKEEQNELQRMMGTDVMKRIDLLVSSSSWDGYNNQTKINKINKILDSVGDRQRKIIRKELTTK